MLLKERYVNLLSPRYHGHTPHLKRGGGGGHPSRCVLCIPKQRSLTNQNEGRGVYTRVQTHAPTVCPRKAAPGKGVTPWRRCVEAQGDNDRMTREAKEEDALRAITSVSI